MRAFALVSGVVVSVAGQHYFGTAGYEHTIELMWVQDFSSSYEDDMPALKQQFADAIDELKWTFPHSKFGLAGFVDKPLGSFGYPEAADYCYQLRYRLTRYTSRLQQSLRQAQIHSGRDWKESQLTAMLAAAESSASNWSSTETTPNGYKIHKALVVVTDAGYHEAGDHQGVRANDGDGNVDCLGEDYPSVDQVRHALERHDVTPIFLVTEPVSPIYRNLVRRLGNRGVVATIDSKSLNLKSALFAALKSSLALEPAKPCNGDHCSCKGEGCCDDEYDCEAEAAAVVIHLEQIPKKLRLVVDY